MTKQSTIVATTVLALLLSLVFVVQQVSANPMFEPPVQVDSPANNKIYPSNQVELNFTLIKSFSYHNYTSFSYSLDGKEPQATNQSGMLKDLSSGSHTLIIYGNDSADAYGSDHELLDIVYFSTAYSTAWLTFSLTLAASVATLSLLIFIGRRQLAGRLRRKKRFSFWVGLMGFLFFAGLFFIPSIWHWADEYLFPQFPKELEVSPLFSVFISIPFIITGFFMMMFGTRKGKNQNN